MPPPLSTVDEKRSEGPTPTNDNGNDTTTNSNTTNITRQTNYRPSVSRPTATHSENATWYSDIEEEQDPSKPRPDGKREIQMWECYDKLGFSFPEWKKWVILSVIFTVQMSMNFNSSVYASDAAAIAEHFNISQQAARVGQMIFLVCYAFGCELWAPWSEVCIIFIPGFIY